MAGPASQTARIRAAVAMESRRAGAYNAGVREVFRILDANFNRAREALRVAEDYARFACNDAAAASQAKLLRSTLQTVYQALPAAEMLAARDTPGDVGTALASDTERRRGQARDVAQAACKRLSEALRTIEEYAKLIGPPQAAQIEQLRYRAYTLEQRILLRSELAGRFERVRLYVLLTSALCKGDPLMTAHAAIAGGADCIQLREKSLGERPTLELARRLRALTLQTDTLLIVNDRPDIAALAEADGVHVGQDDLPVEEVRRIVGGARLVGLSTHTIAQACAAVESGADYLGVGPMFPSPTKEIRDIAGPAFLRQVAGEIEIPHVAISGITAENVGELVSAGARRVAVSSAVLAAKDPQAAARAIREKLPE